MTMVRHLSSRTRILLFANGGDGLRQQLRKAVMAGVCLGQRGSSVVKRANAGALLQRFAGCREGGCQDFNKI
jgi:hypothetical protein